MDEDLDHFMGSSVGSEPKHAVQRKCPLHEVLNALLWMTRTGSRWASLPHDVPPDKIVHEQALRWCERGRVETLLHDLRLLTRQDARKNNEPTVIIDSRTLQSTPESGQRAADDGGKKRHGTKIHMAVDTLGNLITVLAIPADEQDRAQVSDLCFQVQEVTGANVEPVYADQGQTVDQTARDAAERGGGTASHQTAERREGVALAPQRWSVERSFAWTPRFRRLGRDREQLSSSLTDVHCVAGCMLLLNKLHPMFGSLAGELRSWP